MDKNKIIIGIIIIVVAAGSFFGGTKYQSNNSSQQGNPGGGRNGQFQQRTGQGGQQNQRPVRGDIIGSDSNSITVKMQDGSTKIVILSSTTSINKAAAGTKDDLKNGTTVMVIGTQNTDGSVTAQNIQLNPNFGGRNFGN